LQVNLSLKLLRKKKKQRWLDVLREVLN